MAKKKMEVVESKYGYDLIIERDAGNPVRILTGNQSKDFWMRLKNLAEETLEDIEIESGLGRYPR